jgi:hypothetical protein
MLGPGLERGRPSAEAAAEQHPGPAMPAQQNQNYASKGRPGRNGSPRPSDREAWHDQIEPPTNSGGQVDIEAQLPSSLDFEAGVPPHRVHPGGLIEARGENGSRYLNWVLDPWAELQQLRLPLAAPATGQGRLDLRLQTQGAERVLLGVITPEGGVFVQPLQTRSGWQDVSVSLAEFHRPQAGEIPPPPGQEYGDPWAGRPGEDRRDARQDRRQDRRERRAERRDGEDQHPGGTELGPGQDRPGEGRDPHDPSAIGPPPGISAGPEGGMPGRIRGNPGSNPDADRRPPAGLGLGEGSGPLITSEIRGIVLIVLREPQTDPAESAAMGQALLGVDDVHFAP